MKKKYIVKNKYEFDNIIKHKQKKINDTFIIYFLPNNLPYSRYGISVGKKLGKAVFRNKKKRQIRSILENLEKDYIKKYDYIIILREKGKNISFTKLEKKLSSLLIERKV